MSKFDQNFGEMIPHYTVAELPAAPAITSGLTPLVFVTDAATNACCAVSNGTNWIRLDTGAVVS